MIIVILVLRPSTGRSGLSGRTRTLTNPTNASQRLTAAIAHNRPHEFSHALGRLTDEYLDHNITGLGVDRGAEKFHYIHDNPAVRGLVSSPVEWRWSSAGWYDGQQEHALISMDPIAC